mgnify:CR=1 FL=1
MMPFSQLAGKKILLAVMACILVVVTIVLLSWQQTTGGSDSAQSSKQSASQIAEGSDEAVLNADGQNDPLRQGPSEIEAEIVERIRSGTQSMSRISEGRRQFGKELAVAFSASEISSQNLMDLIASGEQPVIARILYAETLLALGKKQIMTLDVSRLAQELGDVDAPVLSSRIIDILAESSQPWVFDHIARKATAEPAENIRLAAIRAADRFAGEAPVRMLEKMAHDENWYRVRMGSLYGLAAKDPDAHFESIMATVEREREWQDTPPPEGQSRTLNTELVTYAAVKSLAKSDSPETIAYRVSVMQDVTQPSYIRKVATKSLAGISGAKEELLDALWDTNEGVRADAAVSLQGILTSTELSEALKPAIKNTEDPHVVDKLMAIYIATSEN